MRKVFLPDDAVDFAQESPIFATTGQFRAWVDCISVVFATLRLPFQGLTIKG